MWFLQPQGRPPESVPGFPWVLGLYWIPVATWSPSRQAPVLGGCGLARKILKKHNYCDYDKSRNKSPLWHFELFTLFFQSKEGPLQPMPSLYSLHLTLSHQPTLLPCLCSNGFLLAIHMKTGFVNTSVKDGQSTNSPF